MYIVYRYMIGDKWIYVGKTKHSLRQRISDHTSDQRFVPYKDATISYCELDSESDMDILELMLIKIIKPVLNNNDTTTNTFPFVLTESSLEWKEYKDYHELMASENRGRPIVGDEKLDRTIKIRMGPTLINEINKASKIMKVSAAQFIRNSIIFYMKCIKFGFMPIDSTLIM